MIKLEDALIIHKILINKYGGTPGIRDLNLLKSGIERPFAGIGQNLFYPSPQEQAAAVFESIINNHPFIDGNKRTGYVFMRLILNINNISITASQDEKLKFVLRAAEGELKYNQILEWIINNSEPK